jgi:MFS family permease
LKAVLPGAVALTAGPAPRKTTGIRHQNKVEMTTLAGPAAPAHSLRDVWLITIGHALTHWYPATFYLLLPLIGNELGLSYVQIGSILTTQAFAGALSNIPGGLFVDSIGRKGLLMAVSLFWIGAPYLLMGFSHDYWLLLTCAGLVGIGNNLWHPTAIPLLAQRYPERKGWWFRSTAWAAMSATRPRRWLPARC